ncbi:MAG: glycosyltransferase, partial [Acidobacteriota bacterium]
AAAICAKLAHVPYLIRPLGVLGKWGMQHRRPWLKKLSFWLIESHILRNAAGVHYTSEQESEEATQLGVKHTSLIIANPVDIVAARTTRGSFRATYPALASKTIVLFLSRIDTKKGLPLLLSAYARLRLNYPNVVLVVAGDGDRTLIDDLKRQAHQLGLGQAILWTGFLQGEAKVNILADADVFVLPSYSENFGVAVVEAMAAGLPVIISDQVGIHQEIAEAGAGVVIQCDVNELEAAMVRMLSNAELRQRMGANAAALAELFAPPTIALQLKQAYSQVLKKCPRPAVV